MILLSGTIEINADHKDLILEPIATLVAHTLTEPGCITYGYWEDITTPGRFRVFEEWESDDAIAAHMASPHMAEFLTALGGIELRGTRITRYEVSETTRFM